MAIINHRLAWQIQKGKEIIANLPKEDQDCVIAIIKNLEEALDKERQINKEYQEWFNKLKQFIR